MFIPLWLILLAVSSCEFLEDFEKGNGNIISEKREVGDFSSIRVGGSFDVLLEHGKDNRLMIIADENLQPFIMTEVRGNTLEIMQERKLISKEKLRIVIVYDDLASIRVTGAASIHNEGYIQQEMLDLRVDGAAIVDLKIRTDRLKVVLSGAGVIKLSGDTGSQDLNLTGAGGLKAFNLKSRKCNVAVGGIGGAEVFVTEELDATIEGVGGIEYEGNPLQIRTTINGIGKIKPVEEQ